MRRSVSSGPVHIVRVLAALPATSAGARSPHERRRTERRPVCAASARSRSSNSAVASASAAGVVAGRALDAEARPANRRGCGCRGDARREPAPRRAARGRATARRRAAMPARGERAMRSTVAIEIGMEADARRMRGPIARTPTARRGAGTPAACAPRPMPCTTMFAASPAHRSRSTTSKLSSSRMPGVVDGDRADREQAVALRGPRPEVSVSTTTQRSVPAPPGARPSQRRQRQRRNDARARHPG